jgi:hypothetical protein
MARVPTGHGTWLRDRRLRVSTKSTVSGDAGAQNELGILLETRLEPPDLAGARAWRGTAGRRGG